jgi:hypothetical protein
MMLSLIKAAKQDQQGPLAHKAFKAHQVLRVRKALQEHKDRKAFQVTPAHKENPVLPARLVQLVAYFQQK